MINLININVQNKIKQHNTIRDNAPNNPSFKGKPSSLLDCGLKIPQEGNISAQEAIKAWKKLKNFKFSDALSDSQYPQNKTIRMKNYDVFDRVNEPKEMEAFCNAFLSHESIDKGMVKNPQQVLLDTINRATKSLKKDYGDFNILAVGSNQGLNDANGVIPHVGMRLNSPYIILSRDQNQTTSSSITDRKLVRAVSFKFKQELDHRLITTNRPHSTPQIMTFKMFKQGLELLDKKAEAMLNSEGAKTKEHYAQKLSEVFDDPRMASEFNIDLAKTLTPKERILAKNFAFTVEAIRENEKTNNKLMEVCKNSLFFNLSNVTQTPAKVKKYNDLKPYTHKAGVKEHLKRVMGEHPDESFSIKQKYAFITDLIKSISADQGDEFRRFIGRDDSMEQELVPVMSELLSKGGTQ